MLLMLMQTLFLGEYNGAWSEKTNQAAFIRVDKRSEGSKYAISIGFRTLLLPELNLGTLPFYPNLLIQRDKQKCTALRLLA